MAEEKLIEVKEDSGDLRRYAMCHALRAARKVRYEVTPWASSRSRSAYLAISSSFS
jgi:hypothetical protein